MGEVWAAKHLRLPGRFVAIKVLHFVTDSAVSVEALARFRREAEIAARLAHPNIVAVLDFNALPSGQPYLVMELLKGESLADRLKRGVLSPSEVQALVRQVGSALYAAHAAGVVHRDLKPDNLFLTRTELGDQVKLLDFGISKLADSKTVQTTDSVLIGTPLYMSPEQATGHNSEVGVQSDVFSLASICYEALVGEPAFAAESVARVVFRIAFEPHTPLAQAAPHVPSAMAAAIERALAKKKEARTPTVDAFVREFTGEALSALDQPRQGAVSSGLATPGMAVSQSMASGPTRGPGNSAPLPTAPPPPLPSHWPRIAAAAGLLAFLVAAVALWPKQPTPPEDTRVPQPPDAALPMVATKVEVEIDAGIEPEAPLDAGPAPDPGGPIAHAAVAKPDEPSAHDRTLLRPLIDAKRAADWGTILGQRFGLEPNLDSPGGKREARLLMAEAACRQKATVSTTIVNSVERDFGKAAFRRAVSLCKAAWPEREW
jgi:eukaryotic-like serine/threonine-protein kinase